MARCNDGESFTVPDEDYSVTSPKIKTRKWRRWHAPGEIVYLFMQDKITGSEFKLLMTVDGLCGTKGPQGKFVWCSCTNATLGDRLNLHPDRVSVMVSRLVNLGLLVRKLVKKKQRPGKPATNELRRYLKTSWSEIPRRKWATMFDE